MKQKNGSLAWVLVFVWVVLQGCGANTGHQRQTATDSQNQNQLFLSGNNTDTPNDTLIEYYLQKAIEDAHFKLIEKRAEIHMEVHNVNSTLAHIENIIKESDGFIKESNLNNLKTVKDKSVVFQDSARLLCQYQTKATLVARVPQQQLSSVLQQIGQQGKQINNRRISTVDHTLDFLEALEMQKLNTQQAQSQQKLLKNAAPLQNKSNVVESGYKANKDAVALTMEMHRLANKVNYSTIRVNITGPKHFRYQKEMNPQAVLKTDNFGARLKNSIVQGISIFQYLILGITYLWPLWLLAALTYWLVVIYRRKKRK